MSNPFIGQITFVGFNFAPRGWSTCAGQLLPISSHTALFSLLGTSFGGDGRSTFALPDLRGRSPVGEGNGPGLPSVTRGQKGGASSFTLTAAKMPSHSHSQTASSDEASTDDSAGNVPADSGDDRFAPVGAGAAMGSTGTTGGGQPVDHRSPYLGLYACIALTGLFPSRS